MRPEGWDKFFMSLLSDRPWEVNVVSKAVSELVEQEDIAKAVYCFFRGGSIDFLTQANRDLGGKKPVDLLRTEEGAEQLRTFLMRNPWL